MFQLLIAGAIGLVGLINAGCGDSGSPAAVGQNDAPVEIIPPPPGGGGGGGGGGSNPIPGIIYFGWSPNSDRIDGYNLYASKTSGIYGAPNRSIATVAGDASAISNVPVDQVGGVPLYVDDRVYGVITAYRYDVNTATSTVEVSESARSNEVSATVATAR